MDNTKICELHSSEGIAAIVWCLKFEIGTVKIPDYLYPGMWASTPNIIEWRKLTQTEFIKVLFTVRQS